MATIIKIGNTYYSDLRMSGKRVRRALSTDKRFAEEKLADLVKQRQAIKYNEPMRDISWDGFKTRYMAYSATKHPRTHYIDQLAFRKLEAAIALVKLESLMPENLEIFKGTLQRSGLALSTINRMLRAIKAAINKAIDWKLLAPDPAYKRVKYMKEAQGKLTYFVPEEVRRILATCNQRWKTIVMLGYYAGLRRAEIRALRTSSIDFVNDRVNVESTDDFTTKSGKRRFIPMKPKLRKYLLHHLSSSIYVLGDDRPGEASMSVAFAKILKRVRIKGSIHTLRHTFASQCIMNGVPPRTVMEWLGHSTMQMTERYTHLVPAYLDKGIDKLPDL